METREKKPGAKVDLFIILTAVICGTAASILLYNDSWLTRRDDVASSEVKRFARVVSAIRDVRRKIHDDFIWNPVKKDDEIFEGDSIFTARESEAEIQFNSSKSTVWLEPNSLVVFKQLQGVPAIDIRQGSMLWRIAKNQKVAVTSQGKPVELTGSSQAEGTELRVMAASPDKKLQVRVVTGQASVRSLEETNASNTPQDIQPNQEAQIETSGKVSSIQSFAIALEGPKENEIVTKDRSETVFFSWDAKPGPTEYKLSVAFDPDFRISMLNMTVPASECKTEGSPARQKCSINPKVNGIGEVFWKVTANNGVTSPVGKFRQFLQATPSPKLPAYGAIFESERGLDPIRFQWLNQGGSQNFHIQISTDNGFANLVHNSIETKTMLEVPLKVEGKYFWRVRAEDASGASPWSSVSTFAIQKLAVSPGPALGVPAPAQQVPFKGPGTSIEFRWAKLESYDQYLFEISDSANFDPLIFSETVPRNNLVWQLPKPKAYYWRVRGIDKSGQATSYSAVRMFNAVAK